MRLFRYSQNPLMVDFDLEHDESKQPQPSIEVVQYSQNPLMDGADSEYAESKQPQPGFQLASCEIDSEGLVSVEFVPELSFRS